MKAVRIIDGSDTFEVQAIDRPELCAGGALVRMEAALVASYMGVLPSGAWITPPRPFVPGQCAVGIVEESAGELFIGQRVYFDAYTGSNDAKTPTADHGFLGCFAVATEAQAAFAEWPNGSFADVIHAPARCFTPIPSAIGAGSDVLCRLGWFGTALAGLERGGFRPGMTLAINGAAGLVGAGAVALALALNASKVLIFGRREQVLQSLVALDPTKVEIGDTSDTAPIDMMLDCASGDAGSVTQTLIKRLRRYGNAAFVGTLAASLPVDASALMRNGNSLVGSFWFTPSTLERLLDLILNDALDLTPFSATKFVLGDIRQAIEHAKTQAGGLNHTVLTSSGSNR